VAKGGVPLPTVRDWLGHANISQTSTYLESTLKGAHEAVRRFEERREFDVQGGATAGGNQGNQVPRSAESTDAKPRSAVN